MAYYPNQPPEIGESRVIYIHISNLHYNKKCVGILEVYGIATRPKGKNENLPITVQDFIYEEVKDPYCREVSCTKGSPGSTNNYDSNGFSTSIGPIHEAINKVCLCLYDHVYCTMR